MQAHEVTGPVKRFGTPSLRIGILLPSAGTTGVILPALIFPWDWPQSSLWMVGLFIAISLVVDGRVPVMTGWSLRRPA